MENIARDSHYVSQAYLRRWADDGRRVYAYRILVSREEVPKWSLRSIRGLVYRRDLYTTFSGGQGVDDFERWVAKEFEEPGLEAVDKVIRRARLTIQDWGCLARFVAAQDLRTPANFIESMKRWEHEIPAILESTVRNSLRKLEEAQRLGIKLETKAEPTPFAGSFRVHINPPMSAEQDQGTVRVEVAVGRGLWIGSMRHLLTGAANVLCQHKWGIAEPDGVAEWVTTDHPVLRLNYYAPGRYDFGGGWGNPGSELLFPLSPRHLLYTQVGKKPLSRFAFSKEQTQLVQRLLAERAHRWVFARQPTGWVAAVRPRVVDRAKFAAEEEAWRRWHDEQLRAETEWATEK